MTAALDTRPRPWIGAALWLGTGLVLLAAWALLPRPEESRELGPGVRVVVVDASASEVRRRPDWRPWVRRLLESEARTALDEGRLLAAVAFASRVALTRAPVEPRAFLEELRGRGGDPFDPARGAGPDDGSRLADALEVAGGLAADPAREPGAVVLAGGESSTGRDPLGPWLALRRAGVALGRIAAPPPTLDDLALLELEVPREIEAGAPVVVRARIAHRPGVARTPVPGARIELEFGHGDERRQRSVPVRLPAGGGTVSLAVELGPAPFGRTEVRARAVLDGLDPVPENDELVRAIQAGGELLVGVVAEPEGLPAARRWLAPTGRSTLAGVQFLFLTGERLPDHLQELDALVSFDLGPRALPELAVASFVEDGGGWLATSGWRFLEDWIPGEEPGGLHALLPAEPAPASAVRRDVVLLVDGSGSMEGAPFDTVRTAALDLVAAALPSDEVSLRFFMARLQEAHAIKPRTRDAAADRLAAEQAARALLGLHVPAGETYILRSLEDFRTARAADPDPALALLLTDGLERETIQDLERRTADLRAALSRARVELVPIAIGERADLDFLARLARPGEAVVRPEGLEDLRAVFRREISGARWRGGAALALERGPAPPGSLAEAVDGPRANDPFDDVPTLERFVRNRLRAGAEGVWFGDEGEPVLAVQRVGLGRTALFASLPADGWAPAWSGRAGLGEPSRMAGLLRWLGRRTEAERGVPRALVDGESLALHGVDPRWPARLEAELLGGAGRGAPVLWRLVLTPPGNAVAFDPMTRREGRWPALALAESEARGENGGVDERLFLRLEVPESAGVGAPGRVVVLPLERGRAPEFRGARPLRLAVFDPGDPGGGPTGLASAPPGGVRRASPVAPALLAAGLLLVFCGFLARGLGTRDR